MIKNINLEKVESVFIILKLSEFKNTFELVEFGDEEEWKQYLII